MTFHVGQKVVCIGVCEWPTAYNETFPVLGQVLTIRTIETNPHWPVAGLRFHEIVNSINYYFDIGDGECCFDCRKFRPAVERKTDISIFQKMLTDERVDA